MKKDDLEDMVLDALEALGGQGQIVEIAREIWQRNELELRQSGDLFYTWQYDIRWAKTKLRDRGLVTVIKQGQHNIWKLLK